MEVKPTEENFIEEKTSVYRRLSDTDRRRFPSMTKEEIIEKYIDMKSRFIKAEKDANCYLLWLKDSMKQYELLKAKYPDLDKLKYNQDWSWVNKIVFVLRKTDRPLLSSEMIELLLPLEPKLQLTRSYQRPQTFSAHLTKAVKYERVVAYKRGGSRGYHYVLPDWIDNQGKLLKAYEDKLFIV